MRDDDKRNHPEQREDYPMAGSPDNVVHITRRPDLDVFLETWDALFPRIAELARGLPDAERLTVLALAMTCGMAAEGIRGAPVPSCTCAVGSPGARIVHHSRYCPLGGAR